MLAHSRHLLMPSCLLLACAVAVLTACGSRPETVSTPYGQRADLQGDPPTRTWVEPEFKKTATLTSGEEYALFNPAVIYMPDDGRIYVWDAGDGRLKAFTPDGKYVATYGEGAGEGPGQVQVYRNVGRLGDSLYVLDPQNRRVSFFGMDGGFGRSEQYRDRVHSLAWASDSTKYELYIGPGLSPRLDITAPSGRQTAVSDLQVRDVSAIVFDGILHATEERAIYVPRGEAFRIRPANAKSLRPCARWKPLRRGQILVP